LPRAAASAEEKVPLAQPVEHLQLFEPRQSAQAAAFRFLGWDDVLKIGITAGGNDSRISPRHQAASGISQSGAARAKAPDVEKFRTLIRLDSP
jgi:hypothetical protein